MWGFSLDALYIWTLQYLPIFSQFYGALLCGIINFITIQCFALKDWPVFCFVHFLIHSLDQLPYKAKEPFPSYDAQSNHVLLAEHVFSDLKCFCLSFNLRLRSVCVFWLLEWFHFLQVLQNTPKCSNVRPLDLKSHVTQGSWSFIDMKE